MKVLGHIPIHATLKIMKIDLSCQSIYFDKENDCFIAVNESRSGSYHDGFDSYEAPTIEVVRKVEKVVTKVEVTWETVSASSVPKEPTPKA